MKQEDTLLNGLYKHQDLLSLSRQVSTDDQRVAVSVQWNGDRKHHRGGGIL